MRETTLDDQRIVNEATADARALKYFEENAYPQEAREMVVNREFIGNRDDIILWGDTDIFFNDTTIFFSDTATKKRGY